MLTYKKGDLFTTNANIIIHGCNCQGKMNSGVAKAIRENYPDAYEIYMEAHKCGALQLGHNIYYHEGNKVIVNALTQKYYGYDNKQYVNYDAIRNCLFQLKFMLKMMEGKIKIAMPKIGCGLGGGDWNIVSGIIEEELNDFEVEVWEL